MRPTRANGIVAMRKQRIAAAIDKTRREQPEIASDIGHLFLQATKVLGDTDPVIGSYAAVLNVDRAVLQRAVNAARRGRRSQQNGRPVALTEEQQKDVEEWVDRMIRAGDGPTLNELGVYIAEKYDQWLSLSWLSKWRQAREHLKLGTGRQIETKHIEALQASETAKHFAALKDAMHGVDLRLLYNMDESMLALTSSGREKCISFARWRTIWKRQKAGKEEHMTLIVCATPFRITPSMTITQVDTLPVQLLERLDSTAVHIKRGSRSVRQMDKNGKLEMKDIRTSWVTRSSFTYWCEKIFLPDVLDQRRALGLSDTVKSLLILDGHASRYEPDTIQLLMDNNVTVYVLPANTTLGTQPLDVFAFKAFKSTFKKMHQKQLVAWQQRNRMAVEKDKISAAGLKRCIMIDAAVDAIQAGLLRDVLARAWEQAGICPWNPLKLRERGLEFDLPADVLESPTMPTRTRNRKTFQVSGGVLTTDINVQQMRDIKARAVQRKRARE